MKVIRHTESNFPGQLKKLTSASSLFDRTIEDRARGIIDRVRAGGDRALIELTRELDHADLDPRRLAVGQEELDAAAKAVSPKLRRSIRAASRNISDFSRKALRRNWSATNAQGLRVGEKFDPFDRVGIYVPGGTAPLVSTVLMTVTLARVAGCPEIVVCTPCGPDGEIHPALLHGLRQSGATEVYRIGGAQAIAAMALGTGRIRAVQKIFGPGNAYVVAAKRLLFGHVSIDLLPGPSEVLVLADATANPRFVAADLLAQAEHGSGHERIWLVTTSGKLIDRVRKEIDRQLPALSRRQFIRKTLAANGWLIQVASIPDAVDLANRLAPEHCEIMCRDAERVSRDIRTAGAIFLGDFAPTVLGDYIAGPSHTLPTGGAGASFAGLTVDQFQRRTSVVKSSRAGLAKSLEPVTEFAAAEGLDAHGRSAAIRLETPAKT